MPNQSNTTNITNGQVPTSEIGESNENPASDNDLVQQSALVQQEQDLDYYRTFLDNLVSVIRDSRSDTVADILALIRSGASNEEIHRALQAVNE